jgi:hypothetical protein
LTDPISSKPGNKKKALSNERKAKEKKRAPSVTVLSVLILTVLNAIEFPAPE